MTIYFIESSYLRKISINNKWHHKERFSRTNHVLLILDTSFSEKNKFYFFENNQTPLARELQRIYLKKKKKLLLHEFHSSYSESYIFIPFDLIATKNPFNKIY